MSFTISETESQFQARVTTVAEEFGWEWMHVGRVGKHVPNGAKGTLGRGWVDLVLVRESRIIFAELKADDGQVTAEQHRVLGILSEAAECYVWRPSQWSLILEVLA